MILTVNKIILRKKNYCNFLKIKIISYIQPFLRFTLIMKYLKKIKSKE